MDSYPFFHFRVSPTEKDKFFSKVLFKPDGDFDIGLFSDFLTKRVINNPGIDRIEIIVPEFEFEDIYGKLHDHSQVNSAWDRRHGLSAHLIGIDSTGEFKSKNTLCGSDENIVERKTCMSAGLEQLCKSNKGVKQEAPPNCVFQKPSGDNHTVFLREGALIGNDAQCAFLAFSILPFMATLEEVPGRVYIDTMAIAPLVYKLIQITNRFKVDAPWYPQIISFHSYSGFKNVNGIRPAHPEQALFLVSASSSGNLPKEIHNEWKVPMSNIITLLTFKSVVSEEDEPIFLKTLECPPHKNILNPTPIEIVGEYFIPKYRNTRKFLLRGAYAPEGLKTLMGQIYDKPIFSVRLNAGVFVSTDEILKLEPFIKWYKKHLEKRVSISVSHIIYADKTSKKMADIAKEILDSKLKNNAQVISSDEIEDTDIDGSVVVVSGVVRNGGNFLDVSRRLRNKVIDKSIVYITGLYLPDSFEKRETFESSLTYSPSRGFKYSFDFWYSFSIGRYGLGCWKDESDLLQAINNDGDFDLRWDEISKVNITEAFWPSLVDGSLRIRKDFAFWPKNFEESKVAGQVGVYFTILAVLQNARDKHGFSSGEYDSVCLSPECFLRFNDGVIQASLLRGCEPSELNYSVDNEASAFMRDFIVGMIQKRGNYEALPEFLVNLTLKKLRLTENDFNQVRDSVKKSNLPEIYKKLIEADEY